ncbi:FAD-dependent oxidoreductase, partial [Corynebacterium propinquum]
MSHTAKRMVIIGGGPAGYEAASAATKYGAKVTLIDDLAPGGNSVLLDCVPSKSFIAGANIKTDLRRADDMGLNEGIGETNLSVKALNERVQVLANEQSADIAEGLEELGVRVINGRASFEEMVSGVTHLVTATHKEDGREELIPCDLVLLATGASPRILPGAQPDGERILTWQQIYNL